MSKNFHKKGSEAPQYLEIKGNGTNDERNQQLVFSNKFAQSELVFVCVGPMRQTRGFLKSFSDVGSVAQN
jgi:hypothetical protein